MTRAFFPLLKRELAAILLSPIVPTVFTCLALILGFNYLVCLQVIESGMRTISPLAAMFSTFPFWIVIMIFTPLLTMRLFSDEYRMGTIEPLLTAPVSMWDVVLSKFTSALLAYLLILISPTLIYLGLFYYYAQAQAVLLWGPILLGYLITLLIGMFWIAIGLFASCLTKNQIVAAVISFTIIVLMFFVGLLGYLAPDSAFRGVLGYIFSYDHMLLFNQGFFDTRPIVFYLSGTAFFLALCHQLLSFRKFRN